MTKDCNRCKLTLPLDRFNRQKDGRLGRQAKCKACTSELYYLPNKDRALARGRARRAIPDIRLRQRQLQMRRRQTHRLVRLLQEARVRARGKGLPFDIKLSDLSMPLFCPVLGIALDHSGGRSEGTPSIDRIDNAKGYVRGNVIIVSWRANRLKNDATVEELRQIVRFYEAVGE